MNLMKWLLNPKMHANMYFEFSYGNTMQYNFLCILRHLAVCKKDKLIIFILIAQSITNHHLNSLKTICTINNLSKKLTIYQINGLGLGIDLPRLLCLSRDCWKPFKSAKQSRQRVESRSIATANRWNHALSLLEEENLINLKLLYLLFDSSLTVQQTDNYK